MQADAQEQTYAGRTTKAEKPGLRLVILLCTKTVSSAAGASQYVCNMLLLMSSSQCLAHRSTTSADLMASWTRQDWAWCASKVLLASLLMSCRL